jgi:hypothetical protein
MGRNFHAESSNLWMQHMRNGAFEEAWKCSDADLKARAGKPCWHLPRHFQYIWNSESLEGKRVLIRCYHGLGDTIQFIRFVPFVKAIAKEVIVWAQPKLIPLLKTMQAIDLLFPLHNGSPEVEYDSDVEIMELAHIFRTTLSTIPSTIPYLHVEPMLLLPDNQEFKVGIVWKAGDWDERRNIPFSYLQPLVDIQNIQVIILQDDPAAAGWKQEFGINAADLNFYDQARVIRGLNLMISIDSMPAHLAGALGVPVWNLLHAHADWRWMNERDDSPWYPTMRLFRQQQEGNWENVIKTVAAELKKLTSNYFKH